MLKKKISFKKDDEYKLNVSLQNIFPVGVFSVGVRLKNGDRTRNYAIFDNIRQFEISKRNNHGWDLLWKPVEKIGIERQ